MKLNFNKTNEALAICSFIWLQVWWIFLITKWTWLIIILSFPIGFCIVWTFCISIGLTKLRGT